MLGAEFQEFCASLRAEARLEGARPIIEARVDDPRVVPGLVGGDPVFGLDDQHGSRASLLERAGGSQANDACSDDEVVEGFV